MDLKITFDVTPALADVAECLCRALELRSTHAHAFRCAAHVEQKADAPAKAENSPVEAPEPGDVSKPAPAPENTADAKSEAVAAQIEEPAPEPVRVERAAEPQVEQSTEPVPKPKRSHHKKAAPEPAPEPVQVAEPEPQAEPQTEQNTEPAPAEPAPAPTAPTIDDVRAVGVKLGAAGKQSVIIDYLKAHGCKSLSQLDPACYAELIGIGKAAL